MQKSVKKRIILISVLAVIVAGLPLYMNYVPLGHDLGFHIARISGIAEGLRDGAFPVKIYPEWFDGYGYAAGVCYGDLLLYFPALLYLIGCPLYIAYQIFVHCVNAMTLFSAYFCFRKIAGDPRRNAPGDGGKTETAAFAAALIYLFAFWRLVDVYTRGAVGEYCAFLFFPPVMLGIWRLLYSEKEIRKPFFDISLPLAIGMTGLILTHIISAFLVVQFLIVLTLLNIRTVFRARKIGAVCAAALLTLGLSAYFTVPFLDYRMNVPMLVDNEKNEIFGSFGTTLTQLLSFSYNPAGNPVPASAADEMPITLGLGVMILVIAVCAAGFGKKDMPHKRFYRHSAILTLLFLLLSTSYFPYAKIGQFLPGLYGILSAIQFPWRYFVIVTFTAVTACAVYFAGNPENRTARRAGCALIAVCVLQGIQYMGDFVNAQGYRADYWNTEEILQSGDIGDYLYMPAATDLEIKRTTEPEAGEGLTLRFARRDGVTWDLEVSGGEEESTLLLPMFAYKGYTARTETGELPVLQGANGRMLLKIPAGYEGKIRTEFREPALWRIAEAVTLLTAGFVLFRVARRRRGRAGKTAAAR